MIGDCTLPALPPSFPRTTVVPAKAGTHTEPARQQLIFCFASSAHRSLNPTMLRRYLEMSMDKSSYVYILASGLNGTIYVGVTSDLVKRVWQHREGLADGFTKQYGIKKLVWYEIHTEIAEAIRREKQIKKWDRNWKIELIQQTNPRWRDLYADITM
jgi:putative endonuclease